MVDILHYEERRAKKVDYRDSNESGGDFPATSLVGEYLLLRPAESDFGHLWQGFNYHLFRDGHQIALSF